MLIFRKKNTMSLLNYKQTMLISFLNISVFFIFLFLSNVNSNLPLYFSAWKFETGLFAPYQLISYQFVHANLEHLLFNLMVFVPISLYLENIIKGRLIYYFLACGIISGIFHMIMYNDNLPLVGASGSIWGLSVLLALTHKSLFFKFFILFTFIFEIVKATVITGDGIAHWCHVGGAIGGLLIFFFEKKIFRLS